MTTDQPIANELPIDLDRLRELLGQESRGDFMVATGADLEWLIAQMICWPTRINPERTTNHSFITHSMSATMLFLLDRIAELEARTRDISPMDERAFPDLEERLARAVLGHIAPLTTEVLEAGPVSGSHPTGQAQGLGAPRFDPGHIASVASLLTKSERDLLLGNCSGWGSWMWSAGSHMVSLGLGTKRGGDIQFDTPLALAVIAHLRASGTEAHRAETPSGSVHDGPVSATSAETPNPSSNTQESSNV